MTSLRPFPALVLMMSCGLAAAQTFQMPRTDIESDPKTDFSTFKTFRWKDSQVPADNPVVHTSVTVYVERALASKGLTKVAQGEADLWVRYYTSKDDSLKGVASQTDVPFSAGNPAGSSTQIDVRKQTSARLVLELYRSKDAVMVWKGSTTSPSIDKDRLDSEVSTAVKRLMSKYPPAPAAPKTP
jgi:hypothetical protein